MTSLDMIPTKQKGTMLWLSSLRKRVNKETEGGNRMKVIKKPKNNKSDMNTLKNILHRVSKTSKICTFCFLTFDLLFVRWQVKIKSNDYPRWHVKSKETLPCALIRLGSFSQAFHAKIFVNRHPLDLCIFFVWWVPNMH